jgi:hypothetical protein
MRLLVLQFAAWQEQRPITSARLAEGTEFVCDVDLTTGAAEVFTDQRRRGKWKDSREDSAYQAIVDEAVILGQKPQPA